MLRVAGLRVQWGRAEVLHGVDLAVDEGEIVGVIGPNGAGKSTALLAISGVVRPRGGHIAYDGDDIGSLKPADVVRRGIVHVPQGRLVFPAMTVLENLLIGGYARERADPDALESVMDLFPVLRDRRSQHAGSLSGGEQQMLAIGRGLMAAPRLLMLDEPQMGLAPAVVERVAAAIRRIHAGGCTILLVGQHAPMALALTSRLYVMEAGQVIVSGPTAEIADDDRIQHAYLGVA